MPRPCPRRAPPSRHRRSRREASWRRASPLWRRRRARGSWSRCRRGRARAGRAFGEFRGLSRIRGWLYKITSSLFELEVSALHEVLPLLDVGVEEFAELGLVVLEKRDADFCQIFARPGLLEHGLDVARDARGELG